MNVIEIKISRDFSPTPGPRYIKESDINNSGEAFRKTVLYPKFKQALSEHKKMVVDLDGTAGFGTSFLEESFGGLIRVENMEYETIIKNLEIISNEEDFLKEDILNYLNDAEQARKK